MSDCHGCSVATLPPPPIDTRRHIVAIVGPPNSGKSTLFNRLTGLRQKVANFPGVTVEHRMGKVKVEGGREVFAIDLPGVYSLEPRTEDERVTHDVLLGQMKDLPKPDAVLLILDSTNLARHLVLAAPVLSLGLPTLVILNMADDLASRGGGVDVAELSMQLGSPVALVSASRGEGFDKVFQFLAGATHSAPRAAPLMQLPVIQDIPKCRAWAANVGNQGQVSGAGSAALDAALGLRIPASRRGTTDLHGGGSRGVPVDLFLGQAGDGPAAGRHHGVRSMGGLPDSQPYFALAGGRRSL